MLLEMIHVWIVQPKYFDIGPNTPLGIYFESDDVRPINISINECSQIPFWFSVSILEFEVIQHHWVQWSPKGLVTKFFFLMEMAYDLVGYQTENLWLEPALWIDKLRSLNEQNTTGFQKEMTTCNYLFHSRWNVVQAWDNA